MDEKCFDLKGFKIGGRWSGSGDCWEVVRRVGGIEGIFEGV